MQTSRKNLIQATASGYDRALSAISHLDGVVSILIRLILGPVLIAAGWEKLAGENWFSQGTLPFPFSVLPTELSWFLASWTEYLGGICLLLGLAVRLWSIL
jgi:putative oxidoreductase